MSFSVIHKMIEIYDESNKRVAIENQEWAFKWILSMNAFLQLKAELKAKEKDTAKGTYTHIRGIAIYIIPEVDEVYVSLMHLPLAQIPKP